MVQEKSHVMMSDPFLIIWISCFAFIVWEHISPITDNFHFLNHKWCTTKPNSFHFREELAVSNWEWMAYDGFALCSEYSCLPLLYLVELNHRTRTRRDHDADENGKKKQNKTKEGHRSLPPVTFLLYLHVFFSSFWPKTSKSSIYCSELP